MEKGYFQKNAVFATTAIGCNILMFIFFLLTILSFDILYLKIIGIIVFAIYTVSDIFLIVYNLVHMNCAGLSFNSKFRKCVLQWSEITNIEIRGKGAGRNPAYKVIIFYSDQELKFITTSWGVDLFIKFCPNDKLHFSELI